jgi:hypothetical protein
MESLLKTPRLVALTASVVLLWQQGSMCWSAPAAKEQFAPSSRVSAAGAAIGINPQRMKKGVHEEIIINAPPSIVWRCMEKQRTIDPDSTSVVKSSKNGVIYVEQKFSFPCPPFGSAECTLKLTEVVNHRVDFKLLESDDLKAMEGSWVLTSSANAKSSKLELYSYVEPYLMIPMFICNALGSRKAKKNLNAVKKLAESMVTQTAEPNSEAL